MGIALLFINPFLKAQDTFTRVISESPVDTTLSTKNELLKKKHSPQKAAILSAVLPGLGQIYNRKYWKLPIIYAGFGTLSYLITYNSLQYSFYRKAYLAKIDDDPLTIDEFPFASEDGLRQRLNQHRRIRDMLIAGAVLLYALNIIDASVDAHLFEFDVSDDLSLCVKPIIAPDFITGSIYKGLGIKLQF